MCRSTQWVVSLNTALSPSSCVVIQDEEYNHTLGSLTPLNLLTHPFRCPDVAIVRSSGRSVAWMLDGIPLTYDAFRERSVLGLVCLDKWVRFSALHMTMS